ncbi:MAG: hypothetical protein BWY76_00809 [bacterium ADurb.Bin429]|nr:MAG: hypothetical protein BWY76_00809 [bacterium ADurb.Bin429]
MRHWVVGALAALLALGAWGAPANLLVNGDFADGMTGWTVAADPGASAGMDAKALKLALAGKGQVTVTGAKAPVKAGMDSLLTVRYHSTGFNAPGKQDVAANITLTWLDADGKSLGAVTQYGFALNAKPNGSGVARLLTPPPGTVAVVPSIRLYAVADNASTLWIDGIQLRPWEDALKAGGKTWRYIPAVEGYFDSRTFRAVADDTTASGLAVIGNPEYAKPGYLSAFLYLRGFKPGTYRITYRLKVTEAPPPDAVAVTLHTSAEFGGPMNSREIRGREFTKPGAWQEFSLRFVLAPWSGYMGCGAVWAGNSIMSLDTVTVTEEEIYTDEHVAALFH